MATLQINENIPDTVKEFIRVHVERQFSDARSMMMLKHCCNFAITALLVNLISGMSTVFTTSRVPPGAVSKTFCESSIRGSRNNRRLFRAKMSSNASTIFYATHSCIRLVFRPKL
jgi:hypothetical protein